MCSVGWVSWKHFSCAVHSSSYSLFCPYSVLCGGKQILKFESIFVGGVTQIHFWHELKTIIVDVIFFIWNCIYSLIYYVGIRLAHWIVQNIIQWRVPTDRTPAAIVSMLKKPFRLIDVCARSYVDLIVRTNHLFVSSSVVPMGQFITRYIDETRLHEGKLIWVLNFNRTSTFREIFSLSNKTPSDQSRSIKDSRICTTEKRSDTTKTNVEVRTRQIPDAN